MLVLLTKINLPLLKQISFFSEAQTGNGAHQFESILNTGLNQYLYPAFWRSVTPPVFYGQSMAQYIPPASDFYAESFAATRLTLPGSFDIPNRAERDDGNESRRYSFDETSYYRQTDHGPYARGNNDLKIPPVINENHESDSPFLAIEPAADGKFR
jgi:hypothetical protein